MLQTSSQAGNARPIGSAFRRTGQEERPDYHLETDRTCPPLGAEKSADYFATQRHDLSVSKNVTRKLRQAGFAEALQMNTEDDGDE